MIVACTAQALVIRSLPETGPATDTGRRMIHGQLATVYGESLDTDWLYVDAPAGRGWSSRRYLTEVEPEVPAVEILDPAWPRLPAGLAELREVFGPPGSPLARAGRARLPDYLKLGWVDQRITVFACHKLMEDVFTSVFEQIHRRGLWPLLVTFDGCYNDRTVTNSQKISTHAWGVGVDLNAATNRLGAVPTMDPRIVAIFRDHGFVWGGEWSRPDGMHFQRVRNY